MSYILHLSHKLRCYTAISGPEKSRNNTREKNIVFSHVCRYSQSAADTSLAFGVTRSGWWMNGKAFTILNTRCLSELSRIMAAKTLEIRIADGQWGSNFPLRGRKPIFWEKNRKLRIQWPWCWHFSRLRMKIDNWKICHWPILAVYLKDFFYR